MRKYWNKRHPDVKIKTLNPDDIWNELNNNLSHVCLNERCWLEQPFIQKSGNKSLMEHTFVPVSPNTWKMDPNEWLTSIDIENVMHQYERAYPEFKFFGPSPIDFSTIMTDGMCVWEELCKFNLKTELDNNKTKMGFIFNTDPHYLGGSHWISMFLNIPQRTITFFDSVGDKAPSQVKTLMTKIVAQGKRLGINIKRQSNIISHQNSNTECGMYSLYFIIQSIQEHFPIDPLKERVPDSEMERFRKVFFRPNDIKT